MMPIVERLTSPIWEEPWWERGRMACTQIHLYGYSRCQPQNTTTTRSGIARRIFLYAPRSMCTIVRKPVAHKPEALRYVMAKPARESMRNRTHMKPGPTGLTSMDHFPFIHPHRRETLPCLPTTLFGEQGVGNAGHSVAGTGIVTHQSPYLTHRKRHIKKQPLTTSI